MPNAIVMTPTDNVATALDEVFAGDIVEIRSDRKVYDFTVKENVSHGHKFALQLIAAGDMVRKYGQSIGVASKEILPGQHVHIHNVESCRGRGDK